MKIGFYIQWNKGSIKSRGNVVGDELFGESIAKYINRISGVSSAELYAPNYLPKEYLDIMIYLNDTEPMKNIANKHVLYLQNGYGKQAYELLKELRKYNYDGYVFFSNYLLELHEKDGYDGIFLPFGVDLEVFYPRPKRKEFEFDFAYIGNDIKGEERTMLYLYPAIKYNFGLFGNWKIPKSRFRFWRNFKKQPIYRKEFEKISKGKIPQEDVPVLYSSAKINLNCTIQSCVDWDVITLRTFEVLACKGFLITDIVPIAKKEMEGCMVFTMGGKDLEEKMEYYLKNPEEREKIAQKGYEYVIKNASIEARVNQLWEYIRGLWNENSVCKSASYQIKKLKT